MALSSTIVKSLMSALTSTGAGNTVADALNQADALNTQTGYVIKTLITATATPATTDFGALKVGDKVIKIPASAGNSIFYTVATLGTLPAAAVIGDLYIVLRAYEAPDASEQKF